jgi:hypothetical protein
MYLPVVHSGGDLFFQLANACYEKGAMILTSNRGLAEWTRPAATPSSQPHSSIACSTMRWSCKSRESSHRLRQQRRTHGRTATIKSLHHAADAQRTITAARQASEKWIPIRDNLSGETGEFCFGTFGKNLSGIDIMPQRHVVRSSQHHHRMERGPQVTALRDWNPVKIGITMLTTVSCSTATIQDGSTIGCLSFTGVHACSEGICVSRSKLASRRVGWTMSAGLAEDCLYLFDHDAQSSGGFGGRADHERTSGEDSFQNETSRLRPAFC